MKLTEFINALDTDADLDFEDTMAIIEANYAYSPTAFQNGEVYNEAGQNEGSCKIFAFAKRNQLNEQQTLKCFGRFYRDVLNTPEGSDHANIRSFIREGWEGIRFDGEPLT